MNKIRVLVVDDQTVVREGLVAILANYPEVEVVGQAADGIQALEIIKQAKPNVVLLDLVMPGLDGLATIPKIREIAPSTRILVVTSFAESDRVYQAIKAGALGYILKDATREQLVQAIRDVAQGRASLQPSIAVKLIQEINHPSELKLHSRSPDPARTGDDPPDRPRPEQPGNCRGTGCQRTDHCEICQQHSG